MVEYKTIYTAYEDSAEMHPDTQETSSAERELADFFKQLDKETMFELDGLIGKLARAYEMQGFLFGLNYSMRGVAQA